MGHARAVVYLIAIDFRAIGVALRLSPRFVDAKFLAYVIHRARRISLALGEEKGAVYAHLDDIGAQGARSRHERRRLHLSREHQ